MRREYEMTADQHAKLMDACAPVPLMYLSGGMPMGRSQQENANDAWKALGDEMGFDHMTVQPVSGKPTTFFRAEPKPDASFDEVISEPGALL